MKKRNIKAMLTLLLFADCKGQEKMQKNPAEEFADAIVDVFVDALVNNFDRNTQIEFANSTASTARNNMTYWLTEESMNGRGMVSGASEVLFLTKDNERFLCSLPNSANFQGYGSSEEIAMVIEAYFNEHVEVENGAFILILGMGSCTNAAFFPVFNNNIDDLNNYINGSMLSGIIGNTDRAGNITGVSPMQDYP
ncbi:MAG: hypothetical protein FWE74_09485 [Oscillospiraceae bacterium]|nr:hypothetical protein [Oscillospiraceae bacterium]